MNEQIVELYQTKDGQAELHVKIDGDTVWLSQAQMVELFERDQSVISRHLRNALSEGEINEKSNMQKMHIANSLRLRVFCTFLNRMTYFLINKRSRLSAMRPWHL